MSEDNKTTALHPENSSLPPEHTSILGGVAVRDGFSAESAPDEVEQLFQSGNLLVRALDPPAIRRDRANDFSLQYDVIDRETDDLFGRGDEHGLWYASSTLLLPERRIPTYKGYGFMFNGQTAELHHIHEKDSGSGGQGEDFVAAKTELSSLAELAATVNDEAPVMNEVNATFQGSDLKGIFAVDAKRPSARVSAWLLQKRLKSTTGLEFPLYIYDIDAGKIDPWHPTDEDVKDMVGKAFQTEKMRTAYAQECATHFET